MNFWYEWTAFRETMSFYGVIDATSRSFTVSTSPKRVGADRQIGVWCIRQFG